MVIGVRAEIGSASALAYAARRVVIRLDMTDSGSCASAHGGERTRAYRLRFGHGTDFGRQN